MPWITATTATRNPTDTMIPSSVKNERSLWLHAVWRAWRMASERGMGLEASAECGIRNAEWTGGLRFRIPHSALALFVSQCLDRIESRRATGRIQSEPDAGEGRRGQRGDNGPQRDVGRDRCQPGNAEGEQATYEHPNRAADEDQGRGLDEELPQDRAARRAERLADADLPGALGHGDHHDRDHADAPHDEADGREHEHHEEEHAADLVPGVQQLVLRDDREVVLLPWLEPAKGA